ncbi:MAG: hypothetical protein M0R68_02680 [Bacteroidetes bacterium]|nr:hypothetical protein [Bacteroidota bacterium]
MKQILVAALFALVLVGCDKSNPVENTTSSEALFSEESMYKTTIMTDVEIEQRHGIDSGHDSLRHGRMLGHLKMFIGLTEIQFDSVKKYAQTMFITLHDIRSQVHDSLITRDQARELVVAARVQFVTSVTLILTAEQVVKFEEWVANFWNNPSHRRGHGGKGGHGGGHGGPGGGPGGRP